MKKLNTAIIGYGLAGKSFHTPLLTAHGGYSIQTVLSSRNNEVKKDLPQANIVSDIQGIIRDPSIDLIINCAPNIHHYDYTDMALEHGKHVVVEKPFVINSQDGLKLIQKAKDKNKILTVFQNRRWDSDLLTVKSILY